MNSSYCFLNWIRRESPSFHQTSTHLAATWSDAPQLQTVPALLWIWILDLDPSSIFSFGYFKYQILPRSDRSSQEWPLQPELWGSWPLWKKLRITAQINLMTQKSMMIHSTSLSIGAAQTCSLLLVLTVFARHLKLTWSIFTIVFFQRLRHFEFFCITFMQICDPRVSANTSVDKQKHSSVYKIFIDAFKNKGYRGSLFK